MSNTQKQLKSSQRRWRNKIQNTSRRSFHIAILGVTVNRSGHNDNELLPELLAASLDSWAKDLQDKDKRWQKKRQEPKRKKKISWYYLFYLFEFFVILQSQQSTWQQRPDALVNRHLTYGTTFYLRLFLLFLMWSWVQTLFQDKNQVQSKKIKEDIYVEDNCHHIKNWQEINCNYYLYGQHQKSFCGKLPSLSHIQQIIVTYGIFCTTHIINFFNKKFMYPVYNFFSSNALYYM